MVTKEEFKQLKQKFWTQPYLNKAIVFTDFLPEKLLFIVPFADPWKKDTRHQIIEYTKDYLIKYYGCDGNIIKGSYTKICFYYSDIIIEGNKKRDELLFFLNNNIKRYGFIINLGIIMFPKYQEFIEELKRNQINVSGLYKYLRPFNFFNEFSTGKLGTNSIKEYFGCSPKDLRELQEYVPKDIYVNMSSVLELKELFSTSVKDICRYFSVYECCSYDEKHSTSKENLKRLRIKLRYLADLEEAGFSIIVYQDYRRGVEMLAPELQKRYPLYPKDFSKIQTLHDEIVIIINRERKKIQAAKQVEQQQRYIEKFYNEAKKLELSDDTYSIIACKDLMDLVREGRNLNHCVGSYIESVSNGREYILFLRRKDSIDTSFFTIDVTPDKICRQIHGHYNCNINDEIRPFIEKWANKFDIDVSNCSGVRCHL